MLIKVIYEIIIHLIILKSSFYQQKVLNKHCQPTPKKRYLNSNNSQCSVTSKQNIYIKKKRYSMYTILKNAHNNTPYTHKPIDNDYWFLICTKIVMLIKNKRQKSKKLKRVCYKFIRCFHEFFFTNFFHEFFTQIFFSFE